MRFGPVSPLLTADKTTFGTPPTHGQPFVRIQPVHALHIDRPTFTLEKNVQTSVSIADPRMGQVPQSDPQKILPVRRTLISVTRSRQPQRIAGPSLADLISHLGVMHQSPFTDRLQTFFDRTSWSIALSRLKSATRFLSFRFSSSSCFNRRSSATPMPENFFFQR